jgi:hypothetical protein
MISARMALVRNMEQRRMNRLVLRLFWMSVIGWKDSVCFSFLTQLGVCKDSFCFH